MFTRYALAALAVCSGAMAQAALTINSPSSLVECQPSLIQWSGGQGPYFVSIIPGGQPSAAPLIDFGEQAGNQLTWTVNITAGTKVTYKVKDQTGTENFNSEVTITEGSSKTCLNSAGTVVTGSAASEAASATSDAGSAPSSSASSAGGAASSAASSAGNVVSSASAAASSVASSARPSGGNAASSAASAGGAAKSAASSAVASAAPTGAAVANIASKGGVLAAFIGVVGAALL